MKYITYLRQKWTNFYYWAITQSRFSYQAVVMHDVPLVTQFTTAKSAELTLMKKLSPADDPNWKRSGAGTPKEYAKWSLTMCGMACTSMVLEYFFGTKYKPVPLAEDALLSGVYENEGSHLSAMQYASFVPWIQKYDLSATVVTKLTLSIIKYALSNNYLVIASVNPNIRGYKTAPDSQVGGHLIVVTGYNEHTNEILLNNPSGFDCLDSQKAHRLSQENFTTFFAGRGILLQPSKS